MINGEVVAFIAIGWCTLRPRWVLVVILPELMFIDVPHHTSSVTLNLSRIIFQLHLCQNCKEITTLNNASNCLAAFERGVNEKICVILAVLADAF